MTLADSIGTLGVGLLLVAFFANLFGYVDHRSRTYQGLNALGGGLACYAALLIPFYPFVALEGTWCLVAVLALARPIPDD